MTRGRSPARDLTVQGPHGRGGSVNARLVAGSVTDMVINLYRAVGAFDGVNGGSVAGG